MEDNLLEHRIRLIQHIQDTWRDSGNRRSLVRILADHTFGMTREELQEFLEGSIAPKLEQAWIDLERERESRKKAEKEASDKEKEIAALRKALEDERNRNKTHVRNRFGSSSRRSRTAKGMSGIASDRTQEKEGFDGDEDNALPL